MTVSNLVARSPGETREAAAKISDRIALKLLSPDLTHKSEIDGIVLDVHRPADVESAAEGSLFGPVLMFGHGVIAMAVVADRSFALPPLNLKLAHDLISGTRIYDMLRGFRNQPSVALDDVVMTRRAMAWVYC